VYLAQRTSNHSVKARMAKTFFQVRDKLCG
jgi:hypothetical protein